MFCNYLDVSPFLFLKVAHLLKTAIMDPEDFLTEYLRGFFYLFRKVWETKLGRCFLIFSQEAGIGILVTINSIRQNQASEQ